MVKIELKELRIVSIAKDKEYDVFVNGLCAATFIKGNIGDGNGARYLARTKGTYVLTSEELFALSIKLDELNFKDKENEEKL